jgi:hypothetical protein
VAKESPKYAAKATFVQVLIEGTTPTTPVTKTNVDAWVSTIKIPYTIGRDPDGKAFEAKKALGPKMTAYILERATRKILAKGSSEVDLLPELDKLP